MTNIPPPIGLIPEHLYEGTNDNRVRGILYSIIRYVESDETVPHFWLEELNRRLSVNLKPTQGNVVMAGDEVHAGVDEEDRCVVSNAIVVEFDSAKDMGEALRKGFTNFTTFKEKGI